MTGPWSWWLVGNRYGGLRVVQARSAVEARGVVRDGIAESFTGEGLSASACRRAGSSYGVYVIAGGCTEDEAKHALDAWDAIDDHQPASDLHRRWAKSNHHRPSLNLSLGDAP